MLENIVRGVGAILKCDGFVFPAKLDKCFLVKLLYSISIKGTYNSERAIVAHFTPTIH